MHHLTDDAAAAAEHRRRWWPVVAAVLFVATLLAVGLTPHPEIGIVLAAVGVSAVLVIGTVRGRRTREGTDERARDRHRQAASFSWYVTALLLTGVSAWAQVEHGTRAASPYIGLIGVVTTSYLGALLWLRWRD